MYCTVLYYTVFYGTILYCTVLYCNVLYCTVLYCTILYCTAVIPLQLVQVLPFVVTILECVLVFIGATFLSLRGYERPVYTSICQYSPLCR